MDTSSIIPPLVSSQVDTETLMVSYDKDVLRVVVPKAANAMNNSTGPTVDVSSDGLPKSTADSTTAVDKQSAAEEVPAAPLNSPLAAVDKEVDHITKSACDVTTTNVIHLVHAAIGWKSNRS